MSLVCAADALFRRALWLHARPNDASVAHASSQSPNHPVLPHNQRCAPPLQAPSTSFSLQPVCATLCGVVGFGIFCARAPEIWAPGAFDIWFHSHQWWHVFTTAGPLLSWKGELGCNLELSLVSLLHDSRVLSGSVPQRDRRLPDFGSGVRQALYGCQFNYFMTIAT